MKKLLVLLTVAACAFAPWAGTAKATHGGPEFRTYGKGAVVFDEDVTQRFDFTARLGEHETEPHGHMNFSQTFNGNVVLAISAEVTCLQVVENRAVVGGRITRTSRPELGLGRGLLFFVTDNTFPGGFQPVPDEFAVDITQQVPQVCPTPAVGSPITSGDIVVIQN